MIFRIANMKYINNIFIGYMCRKIITNKYIGYTANDTSILTETLKIREHAYKNLCQCLCKYFYFQYSHNVLQGTHTSGPKNSVLMFITFLMYFFPDH